MLGRYSRSQPFFCLFIKNGCEGRSKDKERQKPIKPCRRRPWANDFCCVVYLVFSKGGREGGLLPGKKSFNLERNAKPMQIME